MTRSDTAVRQPPRHQMTPPAIHRVLAVLALLAMVFTAPPAIAIENLAKPASIVVDARSGEVLHDSNSNAKRYPASVTKVMTLYVLFEELEAGRMSLKTKMQVSQHAASARPTKLGLKAGSSISVEDAIKSLVTISANDMARTIAEAISGSESAFAARMTKTARRLGMKSTNYANASGWPDPNNYTTVRDQARLGIAIQQRFPQYYKYFQTTKFVYNGRTYLSHNHVLGYMGAVDGLKTGWTTSSGSTILTAARLNGREVVVAVFGYSGHSTRDAKVRELVKAYLPKGSSGGKVQPIPLAPVPSELDAPTIMAVVPMPLPEFRRRELGAQVAIVETASANVSADPIADLLESEATVVAELSFAPPTPMEGTLGAPPAALGMTRPSAPLEFMEPDEAEVAGPAPVQTAALGGWVVQIGAAPSESNANDLLGDAKEQVEGLGSRSGFVERFESRGATYYRARLGGFSTKGEASAACSALEESGFPCLVTAG
jgi:D-alanyl-D-alanine carboxypeptidase